MANITGAMPKPMHEKAKAGLQDIWMAETKKEAIVAFDLFVETYGVKYERAVKKLTKDRDVLLTFYDFPAEHWKHIRTTNPIESVFATVRNRTRKTKGCLSRKTALSMVFKLMMSAKKKWRKLSGTNRLPESHLRGRVSDFLCIHRVIGYPNFDVLTSGAGRIQLYSSHLKTRIFRHLKTAT